MFTRIDFEISICESTPHAHQRMLGRKVAFKNITAPLTIFVADVPNLNLLGRNAIKELCISVDEVLHGTKTQSWRFDKMMIQVSKPHASSYVENSKTYLSLSWDVSEISNSKWSLKIKPSPFTMPRSVPFVMQEDLAVTHEAEILRGIWTQVEFNDWGTPVVPMRKKQTGSKKPKLRICGHYSVTVNPQLALHRHLPSPKELMRKLGGGHGFSKINLADAHNQVKLCPQSRKRLALRGKVRTHDHVVPINHPSSFPQKSNLGFFFNFFWQL